jgi:hypothetical protein
MKDINRDGSAKNDILYIPRNQSEIKLQNIVDGNNTVLVSRLNNGISWMLISIIATT